MIARAFCQSFAIAPLLDYNVMRKSVRPVAPHQEGILPPREAGLTLELNKLTGQVDAMGRLMATRRDDLSEKAREARTYLGEHPEVTDELLKKIERARQTDEWRRGAMPLGTRLDERHTPRPVPGSYVLIAADGSQIYPDRHAVAQYYLLNTGAIVFRCGSGQAPAIVSTPEVFYADADLYDDDGNVRSAEFVSSQRNRREIQALADLAEADRTALGGDLSVPIICVLDGPLLPWMRPDPENRDAINEELDFFVAQLQRLRRAAAIPVGYVDRPGSANVLRILELLKMDIDAITRDTLRQGRFLQLTDRLLFDSLEPGERTGLFQPNSNINERYKGKSGDRIVFAYANMAQRAGPDNAALARIEVPGWVAEDPAQLDIAHAALYDNCEPVRYPYVLARAHELAVVTHAEKADLENMLVHVMMRNGMMPEQSVKAIDKLFTSSRR
jgi:hypothetical protein